MKRFISTALLTVSTAASAQFYSGNELLERMQDPARASIAMGYVAGVVDMGASEYHCLPADATLGQIRDVVRQYLTSNPTSRHMSAAVLVTLPLMAAWPCPNKKGNL